MTQLFETEKDVPLATPYFSRCSNHAHEAIGVKPVFRTEVNCYGD